MALTQRRRCMLLALPLAVVFGAVGSACRLDPLPTGPRDRIQIELSRELERFRTRTDSNAACAAIATLRTKARSGSRASTDERILQELTKAKPQDLPPRCIDLLAKLPNAPDSLFVRILEQAGHHSKPRVFAAAARALGRRAQDPRLLAAAALLAQMTGDGEVSFLGLGCGHLSDFFDRLSQGEPKILVSLLSRMGWETAGPVRQAAWWLLVRRGCSQEAWTRVQGVGRALQARALGRISKPSDNTILAALASATLPGLAVLARAVRPVSPAEFRRLVARVTKAPCPADPGRRALVVALLETLFLSHEEASRQQANAILAPMANCPPPWPETAAAWRRRMKQAKAQPGN